MTDVTAASPTGLATYPNMATGSFTSDGNATSLTLGFTPRHVVVLNFTDVTQYEYREGMGSGNTLKTVAAGTMTADNTGAIAVGLDAGLQEPGSNALLSAAACGTGKLIVWEARG